MALDIEITACSDNCASITGVSADECDVPGTPYPLFVDGVRVATVSITYEGDWITRIHPAEGHMIEVRDDAE